MNIWSYSGLQTEIAGATLILWGWFFLEPLQECNCRKVKINPVTYLTYWTFQGQVLWWLCRDYFGLLIPPVAQKNPVIGRCKSKYLSCLSQGSTGCDDSAVRTGLIPAKGLTASASENRCNLCQLILQKRGKVGFSAELFWEWLIIPSTRTPWCACQAQAVYFGLMGRNASKPYCSTKGSASTSELQGVARTTTNVSFAIKSVHLAESTVFLCIKAGGQHRGVVSHLLQGVMTLLSLQCCSPGIFSLCCNWRDASDLKIYQKFL